MIPGLDILLGGVTGLIGNAFTTWFKYKNAKMDNEHKEKMVALETQAMLEEAKAQIQITKSRIEGDIELADSAAYTESQKTGQEKLFSDTWIDKIYSSGGTYTKWFFQFIGMIIASAFAFVDWLRTFMRPALTMYLVGATTWVTYLAWQIVAKAHGDAIPPDTAIAILAQVVDTIIFLTVSAVTWWFGDRTMSKFLQGMAKEKSGKSSSGNNSDFTM
jgi:hypothetical protein